MATMARRAETVAAVDKLVRAACATGVLVFQPLVPR